MKTSEIYFKYKTTPNLQSHMLRVAGLAKLIVDNLNEAVTVDKNAVIQASLFHDIAKILSFKTVSGVEAEIQNEYKEKYGDNEHIAANTIVAEIPLSSHAQEIIHSNNTKPFLDKIRNIMNSDNYEMKILKYSDSRIAPEGLVTLKGRWDELIQRNPEKKDNTENAEANEIMTTIEKQIQDKCKIDLLAITQKQIDSLKPFLEEMDTSLLT